MKIGGRRPISVVHDTLHWGDEKVPRGLRSLLGIVVAAGGLLGFLPILGFWMLPLGLALIALDVPALRRRVLAWVARKDRQSAEREAAASGGR